LLQKQDALYKSIQAEDVERLDKLRESISAS